MEGQSSNSSHSSISKVFTPPIKRLGLSRKRKSNSFETDSPIKIQNVANNTVLVKKIISTNKEDYKKKDENCYTMEKNITDSLNYDKEIDKIKKRIEEKQEKMKNLQNNNKVIELENLIKVWKEGCKNAFLYLDEILKKKQIENYSYKKVLQSLGIWNVLFETFEDDRNIDFLEYS